MMGYKLDDGKSVLNNFQDVLPEQFEVIKKIFEKQKEESEEEQEDAN